MHVEEEYAYLYVEFGFAPYEYQLSHYPSVIIREKLLVEYLYSHLISQNNYIA